MPTPSVTRVAFRYLRAAEKALSLTTEQEVKVHDLLRKHDGKAIPDKLVHDLADELGIETDRLEGYIYGIASKHLMHTDVDVNPGGRAEEKGVTEKDFDKATIDKGIKVELEHTGDKAEAKRIVLDHLAESPDYYEALDKMEAELEKAASRVASRYLLQLQPDYGESDAALPRGKDGSWEDVEWDRYEEQMAKSDAQDRLGEDASEAAGEFMQELSSQLAKHGWAWKDEGEDSSHSDSGSDWWSATVTGSIEVNAMGRRFLVTIETTHTVSADADEDGPTSYTSNSFNITVEDLELEEYASKDELDEDDAPDWIVNTIRGFLGPLAKLIGSGWELGTNLNLYKKIASNFRISPAPKEADDVLVQSYSANLGWRSKEKLIAYYFVLAGYVAVMPPPERDYKWKGIVRPSPVVLTTKPNAVEAQTRKAIQRMQEQTRKQMAEQEKQRELKWQRQAFNKYDPNELLTALVSILDKYELRDVVREVKKLTPKIQQAWKSREIE